MAGVPTVTGLNALVAALVSSAVSCLACVPVFYRVGRWLACACVCGGCGRHWLMGIHKHMLVVCSGSCSGLCGDFLWLWRGFAAFICTLLKVAYSVACLDIIVNHNIFTCSSAGEKYRFYVALISVQAERRTTQWAKPASNQTSPVLSWKTSSLQH